ncbi:MAG: hypothetical protein Q8O90_06300, partial [Elusimicrobiota bacterium]|nr:hypothetical protein [Elusimicrobiota bacterium]
MNFFRLRIVNTFLLFLIGIVMGFILKEKFYPAPKAPAQPVYQASYQARTEAPPEIQPEAEEPTDEPYPVQEPEPVSAPQRGSREPVEEASPPATEALVIEAASVSAESRAGKRPVARGKQEEFFRNPAVYEGQELEMELQMITAKKSPRGWRINLVYTSPDKKTDYLYLEDSELLGEKPDLRIGYVYKVRFLSGK